MKDDEEIKTGLKSQVPDTGGNSSIKQALS
jgi:hypothetical protein